MSTYQITIHATATVKVYVSDVVDDLLEWEDDDSDRAIDDAITASVVAYVADESPTFQWQTPRALIDDVREALRKRRAEENNDE